jgi:predicted transcriptional regulator
MSSPVMITFEESAENVRILDEIASNMDVDRASVLREAVAFLIANYKDLNADIDQARRQIDAGRFTLHEDVVREFRNGVVKSRAA